ncbi:hypothetical protein JKP88DRAFT_351241 [Tribonema minus]|uniref:Tropinone reductase n=1 Tax=Tribonema minus TaxID=303371 RepID=A0A835YM08_9STRA|nr:hypothetical protein JKP88DRAFT_351241 [Tribonema minus]
MKSRWRLDGQKALVTGGTKGIGNAIVVELAHLGAEVYTCARSDADLQQCLAEWRAQGLKVHGSVADVSSAEDRAALLQKVGEAFGGSLDILVNNVGTSIRRATVDYTSEEAEHVLRVNFHSCFAMMQLCHPLLKEAQGGGSVVNIGSVAGVTSIKSGTPYAASKAAMHKVTQNCACEWAGDGIRVNCVAPWYTNTPLASPVFEDKIKYAEILSRTPMKRIAEAEEVSALVAFLCMRGASYITGQVVCVDGGFTQNGWITN